MKTLQEFQQYYNSTLLPVLQDLEGQRKKICRSFTIYLVVLAVLLAGLLLVGFAAGPQMLFIALLAAGGLTALVWWLLTKDFGPAFKRNVIAAIVRFCDPSLRYTPTGSISQSQFMESRLFLHSIDRFRGEDYVAGKVGATALQFSEIHAEYKTTTTDSKGRRQTQWHTIFKGVFFIADFNKNFHGATVVLPDTAQRLFGFLGQKLQEMNVARGQLVKLEDPEFEQLFVVYSDDQVEARYILSTSLMRRIVEYRQRTGCTIYLAFVHSSIFVGISTTRNLFEPRIFQSLLNIDTVRGYLDDLRMAIEIVDDLNLNTRIWTKE